MRASPHKRSIMEKSFRASSPRPPWRAGGLNRLYSYLTFGFIIFTVAYLITTLAPSTRSISFPSSDHRLYNSILNETLGVRELARKAIFRPDILQFEKILVVNLKSRSDMRDAVSIAASLTGLKVQYVDGVTDFDAEHAMPAHPEGGPVNTDGTPLQAKSLGSWRAHMNAIRVIVEENLSSALIIEDDCDWDIRLKAQLQSFALASRSLIQPVKGTTNTFLDPTNPRQSREDKENDIDYEASIGRTVAPTTSPYGDISRWDMLWIGHCGAGLPDSGSTIPLGRVLMKDDPTAPELQHFHHGYGDDLKRFGNHTRVTSWARGTVCNLAYGVSLPGARRFLFDMGVRNMTSTTDTMLRRICDGVNGRERRKCVTVNPPLFNHYRGGPGHVAHTANIRWSTRANMAKLVNGEEDYHDWWLDDMPMPNLRTGEYPT